MKRPVMNPTFAFEKPGKGPQKWRWLRMLLAPLRLVARILLVSPFRAKGHFRNEEGTRFSRFMRGLTYRLAFVPVLLVAFLIAIVMASTHPPTATHGSDPLALGVYYDPVTFVAEDGAKLDGWLVPVIDAKRVLEERENVISRKYPAVVLVHDFFGSREQLLPMVAPLHEAGFVVLAMNLRGSASLARQPQTFGVREARDVKAAVDMLRRRAYVQPDKIALIGVGSGANACIIASKQDGTLSTLVLAEPAKNFDDAFAERMGPDSMWLPPMRQLCRWTFQVMYGVDTGELDVNNYASTIADRKVLLTDGRQGLMQPTSLRAVQHFLQKHLGDQVATTGAAK
jgi:hypothetical protein